MPYTHAQKQLWDTETLEKYPLLGKTFETADLRTRVIISSFDPVARRYRAIWADSHGWSLIAPEHLLDPTVWLEVRL
jgi:hypothetical protein